MVDDRSTSDLNPSTMTTKELAIRVDQKVQEIIREVKNQQEASKHLIKKLLAAIDAFKVMGYNYVDSNLILQILDDFTEELNK